MALPISVTYTFATATSAIPLSQLDANFTTVVNGVNGIGNGTNALSNATINGFTGNTAVINVGSGQFYKDTAGLIGMGTTAPVYNLHVKNSGGNCYSAVQYGAGTIGYMLAASNEVWINAFNGTNDVLIFGTGSTERARVSATGNFGIGTAAPAYKLDVNGGVNNTYMRITGDSSDAFYGMDTTGVYCGTTSATKPIRFLTNSTEAARITSGGFLGVNTTNPGYQLTVQTSTSTSFGINKSGAGGWCRENYSAPNAGVYYFDYFATYSSPTQLGYISSNGTTMTYGTSSDVRMKENIVDSPSALDDLEAVKIRSFDWKSKGHHQKFGVIAQELIDVVPDAVQKGQTEEDMWGVGYANLVPMLIKAVQELKAQNDELKARVAALEAK
jgi:hypothetical protein